MNDQDLRVAGLDWFRRMIEATERLSPDELAELDAWERANRDGATIGVADWPGWEERIGRPPWKQALVADGPVADHDSDADTPVPDA